MTISNPRTLITRDDVLRCLAAAGDAGARAKQIAERLDVDASRVCIHLNKLTNGGEVAWVRVTGVDGCNHCRHYYHRDFAPEGAALRKLRARRREAPQAMQVAAPKAPSTAAALKATTATNPNAVQAVDVGSARDTRFTVERLEDGCRFFSAMGFGRYLDNDTAIARAYPAPSRQRKQRTTTP